MRADHGRVEDQPLQVGVLQRLEVWIVADLGGLGSGEELHGVVGANRVLTAEPLNVQSTGASDNTGANIPLVLSPSGGVNCVFADEAVRFLTNSTPLLTQQYLSDIADGQVTVLP